MKTTSPLERIAQLEKLLVHYRRGYYRYRAQAVYWRARALGEARRRQELEGTREYSRRWRAKKEISPP